MAATWDSTGFIKNPFSRNPQNRLRSKPKRVEGARAKHRPSTTQHLLTNGDLSGPKHEPNLLDRFFALPPELRNHIYRLLLVQPCKWDLRHDFRTCKPVTFDYPGPSTHWYNEWTVYGCAECNPSEWRRGAPIFVSPIRSVWAPEQTNPFLCDNCYSERIRAKRERCPDLRLVGCVCVRRRNLHVLSVNRRIYEEAARVLWTENMFAFERPGLLGDFLESMAPGTRGLIRRISVVNDSETDTNPDTVGDSMHLPRGKVVLRAIYWLRRCQGLTELELDDCFLSRLSWVLRVKNVTPKKRIRFVHDGEVSRGAFLNEYYRPVRKDLYMRRDSEDPLAKALAASMVGQRPLTNRAVKALFGRYRGGQGLVEGDK